MFFFIFKNNTKFANKINPRDITYSVCVKGQGFGGKTGQLSEFFISGRLKNMVKKAEEDKDDEKTAVLIGEPKPQIPVADGDNLDLQGELEEMFKAGAHFGYSLGSRHPKMKPYLFGTRNNITIFDLEKTYACLVEAEKFLTALAKEGKKILIVGTKPGIRQIAEETGKDLAMPYVSERWLGGTLTNFKVIKRRIEHFTDLRQKKATGELNKYTKKEISRFNQELSKLERFFAGIETLIALPPAVLIIDSKKEKTALREARQMSIPIIAILNSDSNPSDIAYPIPANSVSLKSVKYLLDKLAKAYKSGLKSSPNP